MSRVSVVGVPSSAASYAADQDLAPAALRSAGLLEKLTAAGLEVRDDGDLPHQVWSPDRDHPLAQNAGQATASLLQLAGRLETLLARGDLAGAALDHLPPGPLALHIDVHAGDRGEPEQSVLCSTHGRGLHLSKGATCDD